MKKQKIHHKLGIYDEMIELDVSILVSGERKTDAELAMEKWIYNVLESSENKEDRKQFLTHQNTNHIW